MFQDGAFGNPESEYVAIFALAKCSLQKHRRTVCILALRHIFPQSKIVFLHRDLRAILRSWWHTKGYHHLTSAYYRHPYYVMQSDGKYYWQPPSLSGEDLSGVSYAHIIAHANRQSNGPWWDTEEAFRYRTFQLRGALEYHQDKRELLPSADYLDIAYEDLCAKQSRVLGRLFDFLGISWMFEEKAKDFFVSREGVTFAYATVR